MICFEVTIPETFKSLTSGWTVVATVAQSKYEVSGLVIGYYYYFDVAIVTPTGTTNFCAPVKKISGVVAPYQTFRLGLKTDAGRGYNPDRNI